MEKYCEIGKNQLRHNAWIHILISIALLVFSPLILGTRNLDAAQSAKVLETYVALIGIILLTPVFLPEQNKDLRDLITSKQTKITAIYGVRVLLGLIVSTLLVFLYIQVMRAGNCEMETGRFFFGTIAEVIAFGGLGIFAYALGDNLVIGYMAPLVYYAVAIGGGPKYLGNFYPFGMAYDMTSKYWILAAGIILAAAGLWIRRIKS